MGIVRFLQITWEIFLANIFTGYILKNMGFFFQVFKEFGRKNVACEHYPVTLLQIPCM